MLLSQPRWTLRCFAALGSVTAGVAVSFYIPNRQILSNFDPTFWFQVSDYIIIYRIHILTLQYTTVHYHIIYVYIYISIILYIHRCTSHIVYITYAHICIYIHHNCLHIYMIIYIYICTMRSHCHITVHHVHAYQQKRFLMHRIIFARVSRRSPCETTNH